MTTWIQQMFCPNPKLLQILCFSQAGTMRVRKPPTFSCVRSCLCGWPTPWERSTSCLINCSASPPFDWFRSGEKTLPPALLLMLPPNDRVYSRSSVLSFILALLGTCRVLLSCWTMRIESRRILMLWTSKWILPWLMIHKWKYSICTVFMTTTNPLSRYRCWFCWL